MSTIVIALGGNALGSNAQEQFDLSKIAAKSIVDLAESGHNAVVVHGNGPQVGEIKKLMDASKFDMLLEEYTAMSQGYIGFHLVQCLQNELKKRGISKEAAAVITQILVDKNDPSFSSPTKPIGSFYSEEEAVELMAGTGLKYAEDSGRGWRLVVPSPMPVDICEKNVIKQLVESGCITVACGGGGIPVEDRNGALSGLEAVIDKDFAAAKLAELISADCLFILTAVDRVKINFGKPDEKALSEISVSEARRYIAEGHFAPGSMLPKVEAALMFVESGSGKKAIIGSLTQAADAVKGKSGTAILSD